MNIATDWVVSAGSALLMFVITGSWLVSIHAQNQAKAISRGWFALSAWAQIGLGFAAVALFIWFGFRLWIPLSLRLPDPVIPLLRSIGLVIFLVGLFLVLWARWALGAMYGVSTGSSAPLQDKHRFIQRGPYGFVRHPMYLGYWLVILGALLIYRTWTPLMLLIVAVPSFYRRARREEIALEERFGLEWQTFARKVPMFLPRWRINPKKSLYI